MNIDVEKFAVERGASYTYPTTKINLSISTLLLRTILDDYHQEKLKQEFGSIDKSAWIPMPVEPANEMLQAAMSANYGGKVNIGRQTVLIAYKAMMSVAPKLPKPEPAAIQRLSETGWIEVNKEDVEHYRAKGQEIRNLYPESYFCAR